MSRSKKSKAFLKTRASIERDLDRRGLSWQSKDKGQFIVVYILDGERTVSRACRTLLPIDTGEMKSAIETDALHSSYLSYCVEEGIEAAIGKESYS